MTTKKTAAKPRNPSPATKKAEPEAEVIAKIASMLAPDRALAERLHTILKASAPSLAPRLWYSMPAYELDGKLICFFQSAQRFKTRYATLGFMHAARLDDGAMWPVSYALTQLNAAEEEKIIALVKKALR